MHFGVLRAAGRAGLAARVRRLSEVEHEFEPLPFHGPVARAYAECRQGGDRTYQPACASVDLSAQPEHGKQGLVNSPHLCSGHVARKVAQSGDVDGAGLFHQHFGALSFHLDFGPERGVSGVDRGGGHQNYGAGEKLICLDHHAEPPPPLLVTAA